MRIKRNFLRALLKEDCGCQAGITIELGQDESGEKALLHALAAMRFLYTVDQQTHWQSRGQAFYGDHLMMQRIYGMAQEDVDSLAERMAGLLGYEAIDLPNQLDELMNCPDAATIAEERDPVAMATMAEKHALWTLENAYETCKRDGTLTLGLDDLLMSMCSNREVALYLLGQRVN